MLRCVKNSQPTSQSLPERRVLRPLKNVIKSYLSGLVGWDLSRTNTVKVIYRLSPA